jgi:hypothetical protein
LQVAKRCPRAKGALPFAALLAMLIVTMIVYNVVPLPTVGSRAGLGQDCYCHKGLASTLSVNGTGVDIVDLKVKRGSSFSLLVNAQFRPAWGDTTPLSVGWLSDMGNNSRFEFNPREVFDNSQQDQDPANSSVVVLFKLAAPNQPGEYSLVISYHGGVSKIAVQVASDIVGASRSYAAISQVHGPFASSPGDNVTLSILLKNNHTEPAILYIYGANNSTNQAVFSKVYSDAPIAANGVIVLSGTFKMPNGTLIVTIHSGHVEDGKDVNDDRFNLLMLQSIPPHTEVTFTVLAAKWAPWIALAAASIGSVLLARAYARRENPLSSKD